MAAAEMPPPAKGSDLWTSATPLSNSDFRKLLETPRPDRGGQTPSRNRKTERTSKAKGGAKRTGAYVGAETPSGGYGGGETPSGKLGGGETPGGGQKKPPSGKPRPKGDADKAKEAKEGEQEYRCVLGVGAHC